MDSQVLEILSNLRYGSILKDLYILGLSPTNKLKIVLQFLSTTNIEHLWWVKIQFSYYYSN